MRGSFIAQKERARCFYQFLSNLLIFSMQGFIQALTYVYRRSKLNLKLSFETQSFKLKNKQVIKTV